MKHIRIFSTLFLMALLTSSAVAQIVSPFDFMRTNPRSVDANPATYTEDYGYFDMLLGGVNVGVVNVGLKYDKFFRFNETGQPTVVDLNSGVASLRDKNYLNSYANVDVFHCGRRTKHGYFTYFHRIREVETMSYTKDLVQLLAQGNASFLGESHPADIDVRVSARAYQEFNFGYQMSLTDQWNIGARLKFLMGYADVKSNAAKVQFYTDPDTYAWKVMSDVDVRATLPYEFVLKDGKLDIEDARFNMAKLFKNYGFGLDLGGEYQINGQWGVAAAINDLGFINWKTHTAQFKGEVQDAGSFYDNGNIVFSGLTEEQIDGMIHDSTYFVRLMDTLTKCFQLTPEGLGTYTTGLYTNMMVRGYYDLTPAHRFSAQLTGYNLGMGIKPALTLAYTGSFKGKYDLVATYTMMKGSFDNLGIGASANLGGLLIYVATNNLFGCFNPANRSHINAQFGISFTSGVRVDRSETIILRDKAAEADADAEEAVIN